MEIQELESKIMETVARIGITARAYAKAEAEYLNRKDLAELTFEALKEFNRVEGVKTSEAELSRLASISKNWEEEVKLLNQARTEYFNAKAEMKIAESTLDALRSISSIEKMKANIL